MVLVFFKILLVFAVTTLGVSGVAFLTNMYFENQYQDHAPEEKASQEITNYNILYDESKGHVVTAEVFGITKYLMRKRGLADHEIRRDYYKKLIVYSYDDYAKYLEKKKNTINLSICREVFKDPFNYLNLGSASRYSDKDLPKLEKLVQELNREQKFHKSLDELLSMSLIYETDEDIEYYFNQISLKLEA